MRTEMGISSRCRKIVAAMTVAAGVVAGVVFGVPLAAVGRSAPDAVSLVNASRAAGGVAPVRGADVLDGLAARHNARMAARAVIFHNDALPSQMAATGVAWTIVGENVGVGPSVSAVHKAFMRSSSHRHNVLQRGYNAIGIDVATGRDGRVYVTEVFAKLRGKSDAVQAAERARPSAGCTTRLAEDGSHVPASFYGLSC